MESLVTQDNLELDTIDSQEIVYDDNSSDNSDCQVISLNISWSNLGKSSKRKRSFYGQADHKGGEGVVSLLGPDRKQM